MEYSKTYWQDSPSTATPLSAANLNKIENGIEAAANAVTALETGKMNVNDATVYHVDTTTQTLTYDNTNPKTIYLNARVSYGSVSNRTGDNCYCFTNLNRYSLALLGGGCNGGTDAGGFCWSCSGEPPRRSVSAGGRLLYVPTATA